MPQKSTDQSPGVKSRRSTLHFCVHKHAASRLHYDLRLEMGGVLKSWAVPKGPSMNPADKRLAVMVEDHELSYLRFEGIIPEGDYGAGDVIVWDIGTYDGADPDKCGEANLLRNLQNGALSFTLRGKKLRGVFSLVRLKHMKGNNWLLIKKRDTFATTENIMEKVKSAISGRVVGADSPPA